MKCIHTGQYCMPEEGVDLQPKQSILTTPEILALSGLFVSEGITKIRLTGGEPLVRKDLSVIIGEIENMNVIYFQWDHYNV